MKDCVTATVTAWKAVKTSTMMHAWNKLLKENDQEESQVEQENFIDEVETIMEFSEKIGVRDFDVNKEIEEDTTSDIENDACSGNEEADTDSGGDEKEKPKKQLTFEHNVNAIG